MRITKTWQQHHTGPKAVCGTAAQSHSHQWSRTAIPGNPWTDVESFLEESSHAFYSPQNVPRLSVGDGYPLKKDVQANNKY